MNQVHAPYHFVPLSKWVYMPDWAHQVSHDVPFKDGLSGKIEYTLTNATELIVGDEQQERKGQPTLVKWAVDPHGNLVIPGSSLKGMLRNVLEIATFGKLSNIDDSHFSYRDISNANTQYQRELYDSIAQAYWVKFDETRQCWTKREAKHIELFHDEFSAFSGCNILNIPFKQPAEEKYKQWPLS
jgi:CRISPR-associated protein (TIGR03986 family)